ncbi:MAG: hypothetical protein Kow00121_07210 [Elainellaceae cyanobacterium]
MLNSRRVFLKVVAIALSVAGLIILSWAMPGDSTELGRVRVEANTVTSDIGTLLRGATMQLEAPDNELSVKAIDENHWRQVKDLKLNLVRFDVKLSTASPRSMTIEEQLPSIDKAVDIAEQLGLYIMIMNSVEPGSYNADELLTFWEVVAPRYKDRPHVLYEMVNEPVGWSPPYSRSIIADLKQVYDLMRSSAPQTHIVLWTFANMPNAALALATIQQMQGVDYTNTTVGWHWYDENDQSGIAPVQAVMAQYPVFMTETSGANAVDRLIQCDQLGISWISLEGKNGIDSLTNVINGVKAGGVSW